MNILQAAIRNPKSFDSGLSVIMEELKEGRRSEHKTSFVEGGYRFVILHKFIDRSFVADLLITPVHNISNRELEVIFDEEVKSFFTEKFGFFPQIRRISIKGFRGGNTELGTVLINGANQSPIVILEKITCNKLEILSCKEVSILDLFGPNELVIKDCNKLLLNDLKKSNFTINVSFHQLTEVDLQDTEISNLILSGMNDKFHAIDSDLGNLSVLSASFRELEFSKCHIRSIMIEESKGLFKMKETIFRGQIELTRITMGYKSKALLMVKEAFNAQGQNSVWFELSDNKFDPSSIEPKEVIWNYNGIKTKENNAEVKRSIINMLKNYYSDKNDVLNSQILSAFEKKWYLENTGINFPLSLSSISNDFGLSLLKPFVLIVIFILLESTILILAAGACSEVLIKNWGLLFNLLNPAHSVQIFTEVFESQSCNPGTFYTNTLHVVDTLIRIIIAYLIFQFAHAFRYKYKLR